MVLVEKSCSAQSFQD